jgi:hypothetical protein
MAANGMVERTSKISSEDEEDEASLWQKTPPPVRSFRGGSPEMTWISWQH